MAEISFKAVFDAVTTALHKAFPEAHVFGETVKQGLSPGDFNVLPIKGTHEKALGLRSKRVSTFDVIFFTPPTKAGAQSALRSLRRCLTCWGVSQRREAINCTAESSTST